MTTSPRCRLCFALTLFAACAPSRADDRPRRAADFKPGSDFAAKATEYMQARAVAIPPDERAVPIAGWCQGAVMAVGSGRVAVFGEAAMFSAQLAGPNQQPMGMNAPEAKQNHQLLLNVMHWLTRLKGMPD